jgi:hypothetical protein
MEATALGAITSDFFPTDADGVPLPNTGLNGMFDPVDPADAVRLNEAFQDGPVEEMFGPSLSAVPWQVEVRHTGQFRGIAATGRSVTILGVTILNLTDPDGPGILHRFINWEEVMAQLGVFYAVRPGAPQDVAPADPQPSPS